MITNWPLLYSRCVELARLAHYNQKRWDGEDYVKHPLRVAASFPNEPEFYTRILTALLHDVVEDNPTISFNRLRELDIPEEVVAAVDALTHRDGDTYAEYLEKLAVNPIAVDVKLADIKDNCEPLPINSQRRQKYEVARLYLQHVKGCKVGVPLP